MNVYSAPRITDLGTLREITQSNSLFFGHAQSASGAGFSAPTSGGGTTVAGGTHPTTAGGTTPAGTTHVSSGTTPAGAGTTHAGSGTTSTGSGTTPGTLVSPGAAQANPTSGTTDAANTAATTAGGQLPFTGYPLAALAGIGAAFSAAGVAIRRRLSRTPQ